MRTVNSETMLAIYVFVTPKKKTLFRQLGNVSTIEEPYASLQAASPYIILRSIQLPQKIVPKSRTKRKWYRPLAYNPGTAQALARGAKSLEIKPGRLLSGKKIPHPSPKTCFSPTFITTSKDVLRAAQIRTNDMSYRQRRSSFGPW